MTTAVSETYDMIGMVLVERLAPISPLKLASFGTLRSRMLWTLVNAAETAAQHTTKLASNPAVSSKHDPGSRISDLACEENLLFDYLPVRVNITTFFQEQ